MTFYNVIEVLNIQTAGTPDESAAGMIDGTSQDKILTGYTDGSIESIRRTVASFKTH